MMKAMYKITQFICGAVLVAFVWWLVAHVGETTDIRVASGFFGASILSMAAIIISEIGIQEEEKNERMAHSRRGR